MADIATASVSGSTPFSLTKSNGSLVVSYSDGRVVAPEVDELNKVFQRIEQEKIYANSAESDVAHIADEVIGGTPVLDALTKARAIEEKLDAEKKKIKKSAFTIYSTDEHGNRIEYLDRSSTPFDILIHTEDLPVSEEKANFKVEVDRTMLVINQVLKPGDHSKWSSPLNVDPDRRAKYIRGLRGICHVGLEHDDPDQLKLAKKSLESFREEFVANEAGAVKNRYLWRLGLRCLAMSVVASLCYIFALWLDGTHTVYRFRNFFILVAGAGVGAWLSFALRRVIVTFLDLAALEEDRLDPTLRVLFITALTSIVGLLIWTGAVSVGIGEFKTTAFVNSGATALLVGLLLGIAERTMATAVQQRATEFGAGIGGK
jgi:hypothetical protein